MILKFLDRWAWANQEDPDQTAPQTAQSDQSLHCLPFRLHVLEALLYAKTTFFQILG